MVSVVILDDEEKFRNLFEMQLNSHFKSLGISSSAFFKYDSSEDLRSHLDERPFDDLYFLDNRVYEKKGTEEDRRYLSPQFILNTDYLLWKNPNARIYSIGSPITPEVKAHCLEKDFGIIDKVLFGDYLREHFTPEFLKDFD